MNAEQKAAGLSPAQKRALIDAAPCKGGSWWTPHPVKDTALSRLGVLTPLGMKVRAILVENQP